MTDVPIKFSYVPLGGGGLIRKIIGVSFGGQSYIAHASDGTMCCRLFPGDTQNIELNNQTTNPSGIAGSGVWDFAIAPSDPSRVYICQGGYVFKSDDHGGTFALTNFPRMGVNLWQVGLGACNSSPGKYYFGMIAVDPANKDVVITYIGDGTLDGNGNPTSVLSTAKVYYSNDGGATTPSIIGDTSGKPITTSLTGNMIGAGIRFDASSGTTGGKTNRILVPTTNVGVWETTDAGGSWTNIGGDGSTTGPKGNVPVADITANGVYFCYDTVTPGDAGVATTGRTGLGKLWKRQSGAWSEVKDGGVSITSCWWITCNPLTNGQLMIPTTLFNPRISSDYGATWASNDHNRAFDTTGDVANLNGIVTIPHVMYDPTVNGKAWFAGGVGFFYADSVPTSGVYTLHAKTKGQEELVTRDALCPPGGDIQLFGVDDRAVYRVFDIEDYSGGLQTTTIANAKTGINHCTALNWASSDPSFLVACVSNSACASETSSDFGHTWSLMPDLTPWSAGSASGVTFSGAMTAGQSVSGTVRTFFPGEAVTDLNFGPIAFNTNMATTLTDIGNAIVALDSRLAFSTASNSIFVSVKFVVSDLSTPFNIGGQRGAVLPTNFIVTGGTPPTVASSTVITGGDIAAASPTNFVALAGDNAIPFYTKDGGTTWKHVPGLPSAILFDNPFLTGQTFSGKINGVSFGPVSFNTSMDQTLTDIVTAIVAVAPTCGCARYSQSGIAPFDARVIRFFAPAFDPVITNMVVGGSGTKPNASFRHFGYHINADYLERHVVVADRVNANTFYMIVWPFGMIKTTDGGDHWTITKSGAPFNADSAFWSARLRAHPTRAGELILSPDFAYNETLKRSTDGGATWTGIALTGNSSGQDWGRAKTVGGPPTLHFFGKYNGSATAYFHSYDDGVSFTQIATSAIVKAQSWAGGGLYAADMNDWTRSYFGLSNGATFGGKNKKWRLSAAA